MRNWKAIAEALAPDIPQEQIARIQPPLDALEAAFRPIAHTAPHETEPAYVLLVAREDA